MSFVVVELARLFVLAIPCSMRITEGLAFGFASYSILKTVRGKGHKVHWAIHPVSAAFIARYVLLK